MATKATKELWKIVKRRASESSSSNEAQNWINQGADIKALSKNGYMIHVVIGEEQRKRISQPLQADNCKRLIYVLQTRASQLLAEAASNGNIQDMSVLVQLGGNCYQADKYGPLGLTGHLLQQQDQNPIRLDVIRFLIENDQQAKLSITKMDNKQQTCLSLAKSNRQCGKDVIEYIQQEFNVMLNTFPSTHFGLPVHEVIEWIRRGANMEATDRNGNTVLCNAILANNMELVKVLVAAGCNTAHKNTNNQTPQQIAQNATPRNAQIVAFLSGQGVNTELRDLILKRKGKLTTDEVHQLLEKGAQINAPIVNNETMLHLLIANKGTPEMVQTFVNDFNADANAMNVNGQRPIEICILYDEQPFAVLQTFLKLNQVTADTFFNSNLNKTVVAWAIEQNRQAAAKIVQSELNLRLWNCIDQFSNDNEKNKTTAMNEVSKLISYGAQINHKHTDEDYEEWTVVHMACRSNTLDLVKYLIEDLKGSYTISNANGDHPIAVAAEHGALSVVQYLRALPETRLNVANRSRQTPLHLATKNHHLLVVIELVEWGADHQALNAVKQTPLELALSNRAKIKEDEISNKKVIHFLKRLILPIDAKQHQPQARLAKPNHDLDQCQLPTPVLVEKVQMADENDQDRLAKKSGFLKMAPNTKLHDACKDGNVYDAKQAIGEGADIRNRNNRNRTPMEVLQSAYREYTTKANLPGNKLEERQRYVAQAMGCQQIAADLQQIAQTKLIESIKQSNAPRVIAYHLAGGQLTCDMLDLACQSSDNIAIIDYLINQSKELYTAMFQYTAPKSPYMTAKENKFTKTENYLHYRLSSECTNAIRSNNVVLVKQLILAGASVDMPDTNNLLVAISHRNNELVQILCENGCKMPSEWLDIQQIQIPQLENMTDNILHTINRCLTDRKLRIAAANGDLNGVIQCQRLGADINSRNAHGSTALFYAVQYGNYFAVVHSLVSCGASMLHSNHEEKHSLIQLCNIYGYDQIATYLAREVNVQFLTAVFNNATQTADALAALGADFNHRDEQERTPLHYAVQYHGIELVQWLCERGANPTIADVNGDYPITLAAEKGDFASIEYLIKKNPATKKQKNKMSVDALGIARKLNYKRIVQLLEGKAVDVPGDDDKAPSKPKYDQKQLIRAAGNGQMLIVKEFIAQRYKNVEEKRLICYQMLQVATRNKQGEVLSILQSYYNSELQAAIPSDIGEGPVVRLKEEYQTMLKGLLAGLSNVIANSSVVLDPADPNTYKELFYSLNSSVEQRTSDISNIHSEQDAILLCKRDTMDLEQKILKLNLELSALATNRDMLAKRIVDTDENLKKVKDVTALQRKELFDNKDATEKQLAMLESSMYVFRRSQEAALRKKYTLEFIKEKPKLFLFFTTIEHNLQSLFNSVLVAQGGLLQRDKSNTKVGMTATTIQAIPTHWIPIIGPILDAIKFPVRKGLEKLDEKRQKKEWYNISTLGSIEELQRTASNTAGLLTLYYQHQIELIDTSGKIKGSNFFGTFMKETKEKVINVRPEEVHEMAVSLVAEHILEWIIESLKSGKDENNHKFIRSKPLAQQLWLIVAKRNPIQQSNLKIMSDTMGVSTGKLKIPLIRTDEYGQKHKLSVQIRYLFGCVSLMDRYGEVYQYQKPREYTDPELVDLDIFGYVYIAPFPADDYTVNIIKSSRNLKEARIDERGRSQILSTFENIVNVVGAFRDDDDDDTDFDDSRVTKETAQQIAKVLREQKIFVDPSDLRDILKKSHDQIEVDINILRDDIREKQQRYETTTKASFEEIKLQLEQAKEELRRDNEQRYNRESRKMMEQMREIEQRLETAIQNRLDEMNGVCISAKSEATNALRIAQKVSESSDLSAQKALQASKHAQQLVESTEQRRQEMKLATDSCVQLVQQTLVKQKEIYEKSLTDLRTKTQQDMDRYKQLVEVSATSAKESEKSSKETAKLIREQLNAQRKERDKLVVAGNESVEYSEKQAKETGGTEKDARCAADLFRTTRNIKQNKFF